MVNLPEALFVVTVLFVVTGLFVVLAVDSGTWMAWQLEKIKQTITQ